MPETPPIRASRRPRIVVVLLAVICACALIAFPAAAAGSNARLTKTYTASQDVIGNPERGFHRHDFDCDGCVPLSGVVSRP